MTDVGDVRGKMGDGSWKSEDGGGRRECDG